jgi:sigma-E factor negative regulatory protein RseA
MDGISALMDGELEDHEALREVAALKTNENARERWDEFHLIGDALRNEPLLSSGFNETFARRLAAEPTILAPQRASARPRRIATYALSAAASLSAAALVAWVALAPNASQMSGQIAAGPREAIVPVTQSQALQSEPSDGRMNEYLLAHEGFSPSTALQGVAPYIRTVSTRPGDGR